MLNVTAGPRPVADRIPSTPPHTPRVGADALGRWPVPEERRTVSVLFADIVGSTRLVDQLDPEEVRALQRAYFDTVARVLRRWGGVVEKYIGDAVMALFGATESDGFDAYRAVRAGLEIQRSLDRRTLPGVPTLRVRVGVATGEAVVDLTTTHNGAHGMASGAVITLAARLQTYAPPGGVVLCTVTHQATNRLIDQRPVPAVAVVGKSLPIEVWHATGPARPKPTRHCGPLIGRRGELAAARAQLVRAVRDRRPRWVSATGPTGSGRSRLLHELVRVVPTIDGASVHWCVAACPPYPEQPLAPVAELVRAFAGIRDQDPTPVVRARLTSAVAAVVPPARRTEVVSALQELLEEPDTSVTAHRGVARWQECLLGLAERQPVVVAVDDLDRGAPEVSRFLHRLLAAARIRALPLAVIALHGPEPTTARLIGGRREGLPLHRLSTRESERLLHHLLHQAGQPAALAKVLLPLVRGLPGRAAAYVASLAPGSAPPVPDPIRRALDTRLDQLDGTRRAVLMAAAAIGTPVTPVLLDRVLGWAPGRAVAALHDLTHQDLLAAGPNGYTVPDPVVASVAAARLTRAVRTEWRTRAAAPAGSGPVQGAATATELGDHRTIVPGDGDVVDPAAAVPDAFGGPSKQHIPLARRPDKDNVSAGRDRHRAVAVTGQRERGVGEQEQVAAVGDAVPVDHRPGHPHPGHRRARRRLDQLDAERTRGDIGSEHVVRGVAPLRVRHRTLTGPVRLRRHRPLPPGRLPPVPVGRTIRHRRSPHYAGRTIRRSCHRTSPPRVRHHRDPAAPRCRVAASPRR